ncbi:hypothetical protein [Marinobacter alexandrii]|uniref:hypothetical protein n=1 Tax=Marinobacter alexandrii TaxID=2570351 RepID=UPI002ABDE25F|nr:hypothetical protein [Marinobacter alexandrii]
MLAPSVHAQSATELQTQLNDLQRQLDDVAESKSSEGRMMPGTNTAVTIGGYVKLDMIYDFDQDMGDSLFVAGLDTANSESDPSFRAHARQSRQPKWAMSKRPLKVTSTVVAVMKFSPTPEGCVFVTLMAS